MKKIHWLILLPMLFISTSAFSQSCPRYLNRDTETIRSLFSTKAVVPQFEIQGGVQAVLTRMNEIAFLGTFTYWQFPTQRLAFQTEYNAWVGSLSYLSLNPPANLSPSGRRFVTRVLSPIYNKLSTSTISGTTETDATAASQAAGLLIKESLSELWRCF
jgi:hypothetical protein